MALITKIEVIRPGFLTTIQDYGRPSGADAGLPWSGAMDRHSYQLVNQLLGMSAMNAVLEIALTGPTLRVDSAIDMALTGADISPKVNGEPVSNDRVYSLKAGDVLSFGKLNNGARAYLGFSKVIDVPLVQNSKSTYLYSKLGGLHGRALKKGDALTLIQPKARTVPARVSLQPIDIYSPLVVQVTKGPEYGALNQQQQQELMSQIYLVDHQSNRMGIRLSADPISKPLRGIQSSGIVRGTVQLPPSGLPIILMADAPTTGGYLRVLNCSDRSINQIAQLNAGDSLVFDWV